VVRELWSACSRLYEDEVLHRAIEPLRRQLLELTRLPESLAKPRRELVAQREAHQRPELADGVLAAKVANCGRDRD
jgi:hypothetical protein